MNNKQLSTAYITKTALFIALLTVFQVLLSPLVSVQPITITLFYLVMLEPLVIPLCVAALLPVTGGFFSGLGLWTVFQSAGWVAVIVLFAAGKRLPFKTFLFKHGADITMLFMAAFLFGAISNLSMLFYMGSVHFGTLVAIELSGLPFDLIHAANNVVLYVLSWKIVDKFSKRHNNESEV